MFNPTGHDDIPFAFILLHDVYIVHRPSPTSRREKEKGKRKKGKNVSYVIEAYDQRIT